MGAFKSYALEGGWSFTIDSCEEIPKEFDYVEEKKEEHQEL